jgi:hypothetical protein
MTARDPRRDQLEKLPREIQPGRDLWPGIAARLDQPADESRAPELAAWRRRLGLRLAPAAAVLVAATLAVIMIAGPAREPAAPPVSAVPEAALATLEEDYALVRADVLDVLDQRCRAWPAAACDGLRSGLRELDRTATDLELALREAPTGSAEARRLAVRYLRTLEQARGLAGHAARL